jgi:hypothetical protein
MTPRPITEREQALIDLYGYCQLGGFRQSKGKFDLLSTIVNSLDLPVMPWC